MNIKRKHLGSKANLPSFRSAPEGFRSRCENVTVQPDLNGSAERQNETSSHNPMGVEAHFPGNQNENPDEVL
jgi:hypothetical protein